jgi:hypothetical protein
VAERTMWVLLAYRLPREPSTPRISVWRKLRQLGAAQIVDGLVTLPNSNRTREQLDWLAQEVIEAAGEAWTWTGTSGSAKQERELIASISLQAAEDYRALAASARSAQSGDGGSQRRTLARLRREFRRIEARDYFAVPERKTAETAIERLAAKSVEAGA